MEKTITNKQQDLNQYLVYEAGLNALDVQNMNPKDKGLFQDALVSE